MDGNTYIQILISTLSKKSNILDTLIQITILQTQDIDSIHFDSEKFDKDLEDKGLLIDQLNQLDDGFEKVYIHVKDLLSTNKEQYKQEIVQLQDLIKQITDKSVRLQTEELRNKERMEAYFSRKRKEIKNFKVSQNTVTNYYKSMPDKHQGQSYFLDKKN